MKYIKNRQHFLNEGISDNALEILADNDENQSPVLKDTLDKLSNISGNKVVTRFSPSPTGFLHIGGIRTALYNYLFAKQNNGMFYLRIEDTDQKRLVPEAEDYIKNALEWVGIEPEYSPWKPGPGQYAIMRQSERDYTTHIKTLIDNGNAYYAFDTENDLKVVREKDKNFSYDAKTRMSMKNSLSLPAEQVSELMKGHYVIRFKVPENRTIKFNDIIRGDVAFESNLMDDKVLVKSNGIPTYHMASVCDDHDMGTTHVIRGEEWLPSTPLHIMLYESFGWTAPYFAHLPLLLNPDGKGKLSKRNALKYGFPVFPMGGQGVDDKGKTVAYSGFKDEGYEPDALVNFLVLLGWSADNSQEMLSMAEMISKFDLNKVHKSGARFDIEKAKWFNTGYLGKKQTHELTPHIDMGSTYTYDDAKLAEIVDLCKKRSTFKKDMQVVADIFFKPVVLSDKDKKSVTDDFRNVFTDFIERVKDINWEHEDIKHLIFEICTEKGVKMGKVMPSLRTAIAGGVPGPDLITSLYILGPSESIIRIKNLIHG